MFNCSKTFLYPQDRYYGGVHVVCGEHSGKETVPVTLVHDLEFSSHILTFTCIHTAVDDVGP